MGRRRDRIGIGRVLAIAACAAASLQTGSRAQAADKQLLAGAWTLNRDLSDQAPPRDERRGDEKERGGRRGFGRGAGRGGFRGGMGRGGRMNGDPEEMTRRRDAIRDIVALPDHLTIVETDSMIVLTGPDGRTTRLSPDGSKIKDENTGIERKTRWEGAKLLSEISGAGPGKITQTFAVDPEQHQLRIVLQMESGRSNQPRSITRVYDADVR